MTFKISPANLSMTVASGNTARPDIPYLLLLVYPICCVLDGLFAAQLQRSLSLLLAIDIATKVLLPLGCLVLLRSSRLKTRMLFSRGQYKATAGEWAFVFVLCMGTAWFGGKVGVLLGFRNGGGEALAAFAVSPATKVVLALYLAISAGFFEEIFFRGGLWVLTVNIHGNKSHLWQEMAFVILSSILFSLAHFESGIGSMASAFIVGISFSYFYVVVGTLWPLVAAHVLTDYVRVLGI